MGHRRGRGPQVLGRDRRRERTEGEGRQDLPRLQRDDGQGRQALPLQLIAATSARIAGGLRLPGFSPRTTRSAPVMPGMLTLAELKKAVAAGDIDTVVVAFVDMQGRLIGKRFQAEYFVAEAHDETHGCDYLLADDIDMEPVPGYAAASWEKGYGDFVMKPDLATLRVTPWLEKTALVLCDVLDHHHHDLAAQPARHPQAARWRGSRPAACAPSSPPSWSSTCSTRTTRPSGRSATRPRHCRPLHPGLPHLPDHQGRGRDAGDPHSASTAPAFRSRTPRASGAPARKRSTSATPTPSRWPTATPSSRTASRRSPGARARPSPSWPSGTTASPAPPRTSTPRCGTRRAASRCSSTPRPSTACRR